MLNRKDNVFLHATSHTQDRYQQVLQTNEHRALIQVFEFLKRKKQTEFETETGKNYAGIYYSCENAKRVKKI